MFRIAGLRLGVQDPLKPKRAMTSYMFYRQANAGQNVQGGWANLKKEEKATYEKMAQEAKAQYAINLAKYKASGRPELFKRDAAKPVMPKNPFFLFMEDFRKTADLTGLSMADQAKKGGQAYKELDKQKYFQYMQTYRASMDKYRAEMDGYLEAGGPKKIRGAGRSSLEGHQALRKLSLTYVSLGSRP